MGTEGMSQEQETSKSSQILKPKPKQNIQIECVQ